MPGPDISNDELKELLLLLCRYPFSETDSDSLARLVGEVRDWHRMVELINTHGIIALAAYNIKEAGLEKEIPADAMALLTNGHHQSLIRNTWLTTQWKKVNEILTGAGIKHLLLKGMALEHMLYGSHGLRQMSDNDILVKKDDAVRAWRLLQEHGFVSDMIKSPLHRKIITCIGKHMPTLRKDGYAVEIHHRLFDEPGRNSILNDAIDNANEISIEGMKAFILKDDIHLEYLKKHCDYHISTVDFQLRLWADMELLSPGSGPQLTEELITEPGKKRTGQHKEVYRSHFRAIPRGSRFRYLLGDIFPSIKWMKKRHGCEAVKAALMYPGRIGKLLWLL